MVRHNNTRGIRLITLVAGVGKVFFVLAIFLDQSANRIRLVVVLLVHLQFHGCFQWWL